MIVAALHGSSHHTDARGANGIYSASTKGFRVYVHSTASCAQADIRMCGGVGITAADASRWGWKVHYLATENQAMSGRGDVKWVDVGEHLVRNDVHVHFHCLDVGGNQLKRFPEGLCELQGLQELDLGSNDLDRLPWGLLRLRRLRVLRLRLGGRRGVDDAAAPRPRRDDGG